MLEPSWPHLAAVWPRFLRVWGSILKVFGAHFLFLMNVCEFKFSIKFAMFKHCFSGSGWAGGVTRSVKNFVCILWFSIFSLDVIYLSFDSLVEGPLYVNLEKEN